MTPILASPAENPILRSTDDTLHRASSVKKKGSMNKDEALGTMGTDMGFWRLPTELQQHTLELLVLRDTKAFCLVSWRAWHAAIGFIWRDVKLIDCRTRYQVPEDVKPWRDPAAWEEGWGDEPGAHHDPMEGQDEHDDTPIVRKLLVLARNNIIASKVLTLTHKCHLPPPSIFQELPNVSFNGQTLSSDWRTLELARLAVENLVNVRTLRIINGHYNLATVLLSEFFCPQRKPSVKRLWLESCSYAGLPVSALGGLESIRLRRLHLIDPEAIYTLSRAGVTRSLLNGVGGFFETTVDLAEEDNQICTPFEVSVQRLRSVNHSALRFLNDKVYENVPEADIYCRHRVSEESAHSWSTRHSSMLKPIALLQPSCDTLRCLTLDWVSSTVSHRNDFACQVDLFDRLSHLTFPNLRAFQLRNAATDQTRLIPEMFLLEPPAIDHKMGLARTHQSVSSIDLLGFMERHPKLQALAWPIDRFFSLDRAQSDTDRERMGAVIGNLGRTLVSLRVDSYYMKSGEPQSDMAFGGSKTRVLRGQRRLFISDFAAHMTSLKHLKIEGGIPRDEKRELLRAVHSSPLEKLVMIGTTFPIGNTWGADGHDLQDIDEGNIQFTGILEAEDEDSIDLAVTLNMPEIPTNFKFIPEYGWSNSPPLMHSIAMHHASTITELKFCGYTGSPVCHRPLPITPGLFYHLRHFHNLRTVIMSFWLMTFFEGDWRETEVINFWLDQRNSSSTALALISDTQDTALSTTENGAFAVQDQQSELEVELVPALASGDDNAHDEGEMIVTGSGAINTMDSTTQGEPDDQEMTDVDEGDIGSLQTIDHVLEVERELELVLEQTSGIEAEPTNHSNCVNGGGPVPVATDVSQATEQGAWQALLAEQDSTFEQEPTFIHASIQENPLIGTAGSAIQPELVTEQDQTIEPVPALQTNTESPTESPPLPGSYPGQNPWQYALQTLYTPRALATGVHNILAPHLSPQARMRRHNDGQRGVNIRASFMLGAETGDIFDLDMFVDEVGIVEETLKGPREEGERFWEKLERRLWF
ncbi:hypothetical protein EG328_003692 [Venturia inaequalis]|uniref:F-box domain-containing protein n=1 Tax=Venturia inaequalis TaxID=5025 RepID=A0A8H3YUT6_VENIN|nr:hypothetical protein EG328_003692 [Venturia inaequalis]